MLDSLFHRASVCESHSGLADGLANKHRRRGRRPGRERRGTGRTFQSVLQRFADVHFEGGGALMEGDEFEARLGMVVVDPH